MEPDFDKLNFYTGTNYMKRSSKTGDSTINASDVDVLHDLGYNPQFVYYVDLDGDGYLWYGGERVFEGTDSSAGAWTYPPIVDGWTTTDTLLFHPTGFSSAEEIYWVVYLDYGA
ncbi:hypothetical protein KDA23_05670 [Candidatus Saccharibacteria bacterium]|nr:hypothetical protein [Candidatus Saccharibacteria bacterium]